MEFSFLPLVRQKILDAQAALTNDLHRNEQLTGAAAPMAAAASSTAAAKERPLWAACRRRTCDVLLQAAAADVDKARARAGQACSPVGRVAPDGAAPELNAALALQAHRTTIGRLQHRS